MLAMRFLATLSGTLPMRVIRTVASATCRASRSETFGSLDVPADMLGSPRRASGVLTGGSHRPVLLARIYPNTKIPTRPGVAFGAEGFVRMSFATSRDQIEGGIVQAASWTLKEQVKFSKDRIESVDWATYPILGFTEVPEIEVIVIDRPELASAGAGEAAQGPTAAAIANAVADAVGARLRDLPLTPDRVRAALSA